MQTSKTPGSTPGSPFSFLTFFASFLAERGAEYADRLQTRNIAIYAQLKRYTAPAAVLRVLSYYACKGLFFCFLPCSKSASNIWIRRSIFPRSLPHFLGLSYFCTQARPEGGENRHPAITAFELPPLISAPLWPRGYVHRYALDGLAKRKNSDRTGYRARGAKKEMGKT